MGLRKLIRKTSWYKNYQAKKESRMSDEEYFIYRHKKIFGYTPDFKNPQTFNEKIIHRILFDRNPIYTALADKLKARIYIATILKDFNANNTLDSNKDANTLVSHTNHITHITTGGGGKYSLNQNNTDLQNNPTLNTTTSITPQTQNKEYCNPNQNNTESSNKTSQATQHKENESINSTSICHTEPLGEVSKTLESKQDLSKDISCLHTRTSEALAHTCKYDKNLDSKNYTLNPAAHPNSAQNLEPTPTEHANKTTNSSSCSVALETLADLGGRSYLSDMTIHHNSANRPNCIDKGVNLENLESIQNTPQNPIPNQATQNLSSLLTKDSLLFKPIDTLTQELFNTNSCPYLPKLYGIYKSVDEIDFSKLPQSFVLKTNHDCGGVVLVKDKESFLKDSKSFNEAMTKLTTHLNTNFYTLYREWHYKDIEPRIFVEEMLLETNANGEAKVPSDYKIHCFDKTQCIQVDTDRFVEHTRSIFDESWSVMPMKYLYQLPNIIPNKPEHLNIMLEIARILIMSPYLRVDLYNIQGRIVVGELTFTPEGGTGRFTPQEWDKKFGDMWKPNPNWFSVAKP